MRIIATICARGGSKGVANKNVRDLNGKPLIAYTIEYLKKWGKADRIICSTDSEAIAAAAKKYGAEVPFMRPAELATDEAPKLPVIKHAVDYAEKEEGKKYDVVIDLDPTAPLRKLSFIDESFEKFKKAGANNLYSVNASRKNPYFNMVELDEKGYAHICKPSQAGFSQRQKSPKVYDMNASIYIFKRDFLAKTSTPHSDKTVVYEMPEEYSVDIDREIDFLFIEFLLKKGVVKLDY